MQFRLQKKRLKKKIIKIEYPIGMFKKKNYIHKALPFPIRASHRENSMIASTHDDPSIPTSSLINLSLKAVEQAALMDLQEVALRMKNPPYFPNIWPGEHYKFLSGLVKVLAPKVIVEIGTATGTSALSMKKTLSRDGKIATFDITSWQNYEDTLLKEKDFSDNRLVQYTDNLFYYENVEKHKNLLQSADLIFIDATHDGVLEEKIMQHFQKLTFENPPILIFDDIRVWTMLKMWRNIKHPKLDLTSFGHWSGTGIVQWTPQKAHLK